MTLDEGGLKVRSAWSGTLTGHEFARATASKYSCCAAASANRGMGTLTFPVPPSPTSTSLKLGTCEAASAIVIMTKYRIDCQSLLWVVLVRTLVNLGRELCLSRAETNETDSDAGRGAMLIARLLWEKSMPRLPPIYGCQAGNSHHDT